MNISIHRLLRQAKNQNEVTPKPKKRAAKKAVAKGESIKEKNKKSIK